MLKKTINFVKLNATGNDFIGIDNRNGLFSEKDSALWKKLCTLKTGIGADGVLLLEPSSKYDFKMRYFNADGGEVEMCGNGARAITAFANLLFEEKKSTYQFETMNGIYECGLDLAHGYRLEMTELYDVDKIKLEALGIKCKNSMYMNTGVPHCVFEVENIKNYPVYDDGKKVRYANLFERGSNANFFEVLGPKHIYVRTYERGVENETLSCGTGVTASAIFAAKLYGFENEILVDTLGGQLAVSFNKDFSKVFLCGKVEKIFSGIVALD